MVRNYEIYYVRFIYIFFILIKGATKQGLMQNTLRSIINSTQLSMSYNTHILTYIKIDVKLHNLKNKTISL